MNIGAWAFGGVWITIWTGVTLAFDIMLVHGVVMQTRAQHWPTAAGRVVSADVVAGSGGEGGTSYTPKIVYTYNVDGVDRRGDRIRYGFGTSGPEAARAAVEQYRKDSVVTVHYDPHSLSRAVLDTTIVSGSDLFGTIFLTPFNVIMLASWYVAAKAIRGKVGELPAGDGVKVIEEYGGVRVRLSRATPLAVAMAAAGGTAFVLIFVIAIGFGFNSIYASAAGWAVIIAAGTIAYRKMRARIDEGWYDLLIHDGPQMLTLAPSLKRPDVAEMRFEDVAAVYVDKKVGTGDDSDSYRVKISRTAKGRASVVVLNTSNQKAADALAAWLRGRLGIETRELGITSARQPSMAGSSLG